MFALNIGIVVVRNAENPRMSGLCSRRLPGMARGRPNAQIDDVESRALEHDVHEILADVVHVALDGAHDERADRLDACLGEKRAEHFERAGHRPPGDEHLGHEEVARSKRAPTSSNEGMAVEQQRLGVEAHLEPGVVSSSTAGVLPTSVASYISLSSSSWFTLHLPCVAGSRAPRTGRWPRPCTGRRLWPTGRG